MAEEYTEEPDPPGSLEFLDVAQTIMDQEKLEMPSTVQEALNLYVVLTTTIEEDAMNTRHKTLYLKIIVESILSLLLFNSVHYLSSFDS